MKRISLILGLLLMAVLPLAAKHVDPETARKVATTFLNNNGAKTDLLTDLSKEAGFPNLYIFNADPGFVVMAADDCVKPILGYSLTESFKMEDMPENISSWLQGYNDKIQYAVANQRSASPETAGLWKNLTNGKTGTALATPIVNALVQTQWDQGSPYNNLCPKKGNTRTVTGCVATAMAQVMKYWNHPTTGTGSHSYTWNSQTLSADFGNTTYQWENMTNTYGNSSTTIQKTAVATLMYHCGVSLEMGYNTSTNGGSSASTYDVMASLQTYFGYAPSMRYESKDDYSEATWITMLKRELDDGRPLQYRGSDADGNGGHSFVCDGYDSDDLFHFNWGWGGYCDGFYAVDDMAPGTGGIGSGNGVYTVGESAIFGIEPFSSLTAPTLSASLDQNTITLTWNAIDGALSYDLYRNNEKIGTGITNTSYVDADKEFGVYYEYYVRSVFSGGRSNPSNRVIKCPLYRDITPSNLNVDLESNNAEFTWTGYPGGLSADLHYGTLMSNYLYGTSSSEDAYWAHRYPNTTLSQIKGMTISKVTTYFYFPGTYKMYLYSGNLNENTRTKLAEKTYTKANESVELVNFTFGTPINFDCSKDLWVVFYANSSISYPILFDENYADNNAKFLSSTLEGVFSSGSIEDDDISWLICTYLTDGTYTYNLYDGTTKVNGAVPISGTSYTINNLADGVHQYTVTTNYYGGESDASNMAGVTLGATEINDLNLDTDDVMTVTSGSSLTVNGTLTNTNPAHLLIENNAQLIHPGNAVQATLQKTIEAYSTAAGVNDGWYTIASPVDALGVGLATTGTYDLYTYDEKNMLWLNQEKPTNNITQFNEGQGFLYANAALTTLAFAGNMRATDEQITVPLSCQSNAELNGFNLVGNPFSRNLIPGDLTLGGVALTTYYSVEGGSELVTHNIGTDPIKPGQGFLVQASTTGQNLVFNPPVSKEEAKQAYISIEATDGSFTDRAFVQFSEGNTLNKMTLGDNHVQISIRHDDTDYAAINANTEERELQLYFKAAHNGIHTLSINTTNLEFDYLHLIDNLTGADVDLLQSPSYTFEAKTNNYASRFKLVFNAETNNDVYGNDFVDGKTLILDMTGRVVATDRNARLVPGIYILQTTNGNETHSKKIIIK